MFKKILIALLLLFWTVIMFGQTEFGFKKTNRFFKAAGKEYRIYKKGKKEYYCPFNPITERAQFIPVKRKKKKLIW